MKCMMKSIKSAINFLENKENKSDDDLLALKTYKRVRTLTIINILIVAFLVIDIIVTEHGANKIEEAYKQKYAAPNKVCQIYSIRQETIWLPKEETIEVLSEKIKVPTENYAENDKLMMFVNNSDEIVKISKLSEYYSDIIKPIIIGIVASSIIFIFLIYVVKKKTKKKDEEKKSSVGSKIRSIIYIIIILLGFASVIATAILFSNSPELFSGRVFSGKVENQKVYYNKSNMEATNISELGLNIEGNELELLNSKILIQVDSNTGEITKSELINDVYSKDNVTTTILIVIAIIVFVLDLLLTKKLAKFNFNIEDYNG